MIIVPAIDMLGGKCVRLVKGDYATAHGVADDAVETALMFKSLGATHIHMVDLDGAKNGDGSKLNRETAFKVKKETGLFVEFGGGIRTEADAKQLFENGIDRAIIGSGAVDDTFLKSLINKYGEKIAVGIDAKDGYVALSGWTEQTKIKYDDFAKHVVSLGVTNIICTDISKDGTLGGPAVNMLSVLSECVDADITASGGIKDINDIRRLAEMKLYGAICGKSIYAGTLDLKEAIDGCKAYNSLS